MKLSFWLTRLLCLVGLAWLGAGTGWQGVNVRVQAAVGVASHPSRSLADGNEVYLPLIAHFNPLSWRLGYGVTRGPLTAYPGLPSLQAGWYVDWGVTVQPTLPNQMEYVQTVRVHQKLACGAAHNSDRTACPYAQPLSYVYSPDATTLLAAVQANPGALWLLGNEMDRLDWAYCLQWQGNFCQQVAYDGQDEILPDTYAVAYHDLSALIKQVDPTAKIAIGGVIQATPLRLAYLSKIWDSYAAQYGAPMPVDVWNVHNFIIQEKAHEYGADIPPGIDATTGEYVNALNTHVDLVIFAKQIYAFRQWMKDHDQQNKPLIVSEYGVLYSNPLWGAAASDPQPVQNFMLGTFDYFLKTKDCAVGFPADDCRLVQRWNWYSLEDVSGTFNLYSRLFDPNSFQITATGERFRVYSLQHLEELSKIGY